MGDSHMSHTMWFPQVLAKDFFLMEKDQRVKIAFYHKKDPFYGFTNFSPHPVLMDGKLYPTSEHAFQASKFLPDRPALAEHIRTTSRSPRTAYQEARRLSLEVRPDWREINVTVMERILLLKFTQHQDLATMLLNTGDAMLVETADDEFWGSGLSGKGKNKLGLTLMRVRDHLSQNTIQSQIA